jgi:trk system potassium uptake protein TrkA
VHVVIMGCGRVGSTLARNVERRGHTVAIIDSNPDAFRRLGPSFSGEKITGVGFDQSVLDEAKTGEAGAFAAVSSGDNSNIISARVARETYGIDNVVARIYDPGRAEVYQRLGIPTVATVRWTADQILRKLMPEGSEPDWRDPSGAIRVVEMNAPARWIGHHVLDLDTIGARVCFLTRLGQGMLPTQSTVLQEGDSLRLAIEEARVATVERQLDEGPEVHR